jgi:hypothetical protein
MGAAKAVAKRDTTARHRLQQAWIIDTMLGYHEIEIDTNYATTKNTHAAINVPSKERPMVASSEGGCGSAEGVVSLFLFGVDIG